MKAITNKIVNNKEIIIPSSDFELKANSCIVYRVSKFCPNTNIMESNYAFAIQPLSN